MINDEMAGVKEGDILAGKYRVDRVLGVGGMGIVVAAHHLELDDRVAIKLLRPETLNNREAVARFAREARAAVKVKSEHVARVTDVGTLTNGSPYIVMEYLEGQDLSMWLSERGALPIELAVDFILQAGEAVAEAHALGIVHRDLKPANLFVTRTAGGGQTLKVLDFGISKMTGFTGASATKTSTLLGSPLYMSPEQMQSSKSVDARSDVWALGVILYELIAGASPFIAETMPELVLKITIEMPAPLRNWRPDAPEGLEAVILRSLEKDRERRFRTVGEFATALLPFGSQRAQLSVDRISQVMEAAGMSSKDPVLLSDSSARTSAHGSSTVTAFESSRFGSRRARPLAYGAAALLALGGAAAFLLRSHGSPGDEPHPTLEPSAVAAAPPPPSAPVAPAPPASASAAPAPSSTAGEKKAPAAGHAAAAHPPQPKGTPPKPGSKPAPPPTSAAPAAKPSPGSLIDDRR